MLGWTAFISRAFLFDGLDRLRRKEVRSLATVNLRPNESQEQLLKRFRKKVAKSGILSTVRRKRWFVSKSELRRIDKKKAVRRHKRRQITDAE
jgi:small subunit ribosomal protein S21